MKWLLYGHLLLKSTGHSRAGNSNANSRNWVKIELVQVYDAFKGILHVNIRNWAEIELILDFMPVLIICKFNEDSIPN